MWVYIKSITVKRLHRIHKEVLNWKEKIKLKQKLQLLNFATNMQPYTMLLSKDSDLLRKTALTWSLLSKLEKFKYDG